MRQCEVNVTITEAKIEFSWQATDLRIELTKTDSTADIWK